MAKMKMTPSEATTEVVVTEGVGHAGGIVGSAFVDRPAAGVDFVPVRCLENYPAANQRNWGKAALTASS